MISLKELAIGYDHELLSDINAEVQNGEFVCIIGKNGSGKTTLLRTIANLIPIKKGTIFIDEMGENSISKEQIGQHIGIMLTERISIKNITVEQFVSFGRYPYHSNSCNFTDTDREIVENAIQMTNLTYKKNNLFETLSDGEKQRTIIAKTIAQNTQNLLLDEPTAHLDLPSKIQILSMLKNLAKTQNKAILISIHEPDFALQIADKIFYIHDNKFIYEKPRIIANSAYFRDDFLCQNLTFDSELLTFKTDFSNI